MENIIDLDLTEEQIDSLKKGLENTDYLKIGNEMFVRQQKVEQLMGGFFKQKATEFHKWILNLPISERTKTVQYENGGWGEIQLDSEELVNKFCTP
jgi:hypothetical protein